MLIQSKTLDITENRIKEIRRGQKEVCTAMNGLLNI